MPQNNMSYDEFNRRHFRQQAAISAMNALVIGAIQVNFEIEGAPYDEKTIAASAWKMADAMLEAESQPA